jgi:thiamine biosynthesis lipoprotein ApbE
VQGLHIADPRSGGAARRHLAAWAIAPVGALSDAFSTAFLVMDTAAVEACCAAHPGISALVVEQASHPNGTDRVVLTAGFSACTKAVF